MSRLAHRFELRMRSAACAHEVCMVRVRKPVRIRADRSEHRALLENEHGVSSRRRQRARRRSTRHPLHTRPRAAPRSSTRSSAPSRAARRQGNGRPSSSDVRISRCGSRGPLSEPAAEERAAQVGAPAAAPSDHAPRRPFDRPVRRVEHPGPMERLVRVRRAFDVKLVARRTTERMLLVRPDLRVDAERPQQRKGTPGNCRARQVEMQGDLAPSAQVHAPGGME